MADKLPWMKFYVDRYLLGDARDRMSPAQRGCYLDLIFHSWRKGGYLPTDEKELRRLAKVSPKFDLTPVLREFNESENGLYHETTMEVILETDEKHRKFVESGRKGGRVAQGRLKAGSSIKNREDKNREDTPIPPQGDLDKSTKPQNRKTPESVAKHLPERFEEWYATYPRKEGRADAVKAWDTPRLSEEQAKAVTQQTTERACHDPQWSDEQYVPMPAGYLRKRRWSDDWRSRVKPKAKPRTESAQAKADREAQEQFSREIEAAKQQPVDIESISDIAKRTIESIKRAQ